MQTIQGDGIIKDGVGERLEMAVGYPSALAALSAWAAFPSWTQALLLGSSCRLSVVV
jgi:hypothetical protein